MVSNTNLPTIKTITIWSLMVSTNMPPTEGNKFTVETHIDL